MARPARRAAGTSRPGAAAETNAPAAAAQRTAPPADACRPSRVRSASLLDSTGYPCDGFGHNPGFRWAGPGDPQGRRLTGTSPWSSATSSSRGTSVATSRSRSATCGWLRARPSRARWSGRRQGHDRAGRDRRRGTDPRGRIPRGAERLPAGSRANRRRRANPWHRMRQSAPYITRGLLLGRLIVPGLGWVWWVVGVVFFVQRLLNLLFPRATAATAASSPSVRSHVHGRPAGLLLTGPVAALWR